MHTLMLLPNLGKGVEDHLPARKWGCYHKNNQKHSDRKTVNLTEVLYRFQNTFRIFFSVLSFLGGICKVLIFRLLSYKACFVPMRRRVIFLDIFRHSMSFLSTEGEGICHWVLFYLGTINELFSKWFFLTTSVSCQGNTDRGKLNGRNHFINKKCKYFTWNLHRNNKPFSHGSRTKEMKKANEYGVSSLIYCLKIFKFL